MAYPYLRREPGNESAGVDPMLSNCLPEAAVLRRLFDYEPITGFLYWRERPSDLATLRNGKRGFDRRYAGTIAGGQNGKVTIFGRQYPIADVVEKIRSDK